MRIACDLDGTLVTCHPKQTTLLRTVCRARGLDLDWDEIWRRKRSGQSTERALVGIGVDQETASEIAARWRGQVEQPYWLQLDSLFPDAARCLQDARDRGHVLMLVTARRRPELVPPQLQRLGVRHYFDAVTVVGPETASEAKAAALRQWSAGVLIGDSEVDLNAAALANVPFVGVSTGQRSPACLGATHVLPSLSQAMAEAESLLRR